MSELIAFIYWDPSPEIFVLPIVHWPILWYGVFFALGFAVGFSLFYSLLVRLMLQTFEETLPDVKKRAMWLTDRLTIYVIAATVIGARVGHFLFYEHPSQYLAKPFEIFLVWKGGLASHGAAVGIVLGVALFAYRYKALLGGLNWLRLLDLICVPTAFAGACIRIGNFCNQEILGTPTSVPWAVVFGHPLDHSAPIPRHPVQLYEALLYLVIFALLWRLTYAPRFFLAKGRLIGLFLFLVFGGRFLLEFVKVEQSSLVVKSFLTMGQWLSIIPIAAGLFLLLLSFRKSGFRYS